MYVCLCVPLIKIHYLISVICSSFSTNMIGYNITVNKRTPFLRSQRSRVEGERNARGKSLVKCLCVCVNLKWMWEYLSLRWNKYPRVVKRNEEGIWSQLTRRRMDGKLSRFLTTWPKVVITLASARGKCQINLSTVEPRWFDEVTKRLSFTRISQIPLNRIKRNESPF